MDLEGPQADEHARKNKKLIKAEEDAELKAEQLADFGVDCYECNDRYMPDEMYPMNDDQGFTQLACKYCI